MAERYEACTCKASNTRTDQVLAAKCLTQEDAEVFADNRTILPLQEALYFSDAAG